MAKTRGCRIGAIRFKSGGSMRLLQKPDPVHRQTILNAIDDWKHGVANDLDEPVGFLAIGWSKDGTYTIHDFFSDQSPVTRSLGPHFVTECMRRRTSLVDND